jgi:hypothetical protein
MRAIILNDTRRGSFAEHAGCNAVMEHLLYLCGQHGVDVVGTFQRADASQSPEFEARLAQVDLVLVNGEGTMHHDTRSARALSQSIICAKRAGKKVALLNALWQDNSVTTECLSSLDFIVARDSVSANQLIESGATRVRVAADLSLYRRPGPDIPDLAFASGAGTGRPLVVDSVDEAAARKLQGFASTHGLPFRVMQNWSVREADTRHPLAACEQFTLTDLAKTALLVSGRFHAVCFALKLGRPFLALPSNSHKLEALLQDAGLPREDFILPTGWEHRPIEHWLAHATAADDRHAGRIKKFAETASASIEKTFGAMAKSIGATSSPLIEVGRSTVVRRRIRICYFNTWAKGLEDAATFVARVPGLNLAPLVTNPKDAALMKKARLDCDWYAENARCFAGMEHPALEFLPAWVAGQPGLADLAQRPGEGTEERWLVTMGHQPQALGAVAGKVYSLLSRLKVRHLFYAFDEASRFMPCFKDIAPYLDVLIHDEAPLEEQGRAAMKAGAVTIHRSWVANVLPFSVPYNEAPEQKILFLGSQLGLTQHRLRQIEFLKTRFKDRFVSSHDHSVAVADRDRLNRYKVGFCPEGRKFGTPAMARTHTDRPFWSGCLGMVPVSEDSQVGGRLQDLHEADVIVRYAHGDLNSLAEACERALAMSEGDRRKLYDWFNRRETVGTVVAEAIAVAPH